MKNFKTLLWGLFLCTYVVFGQAKNNDLTKLSYDGLKKLYFDDAKSKKAKTKYAETYLIKAKNDNDQLKIARAYYWYSLLNEGNDAISYLDSVIKYTINLNDKNFPMSAYVEKAYILNRQFKFKDAIDNFIFAEKYTADNKDYYYNIRLNIAVIKSEDLGEVKEALEIYQECHSYYKSKDLTNIQYYQIYHEVLFDIADAYKALRISDSATYYNRLGYRHAKLTGDNEMLNLFVLNEGANLVLKKNFKPARDSIEKALPNIKSVKDEGNLLAAYYYLGKVYQGMNQKSLAVKNFIKVDSIYRKTKYISPEFTSGYTYVIQYYKDKGNKEEQLKYMTRFMIIDSTLLSNYKNLYKLIKKEYDIPNLVKEKEDLIASLNSKKSIYYIGIGFLILLSTGLTYNQYRLNKNYKKRFEKIIVENSTFNSVNRENNTNVSNEKEVINKVTGIANEIINNILKQLEEFEQKKGFLNTNITIIQLAQDFKTNSKYLSKIVNEYKGKTFILYINDLRVDYAVNQLQFDSRLQKYTIQALSCEFGFNNAESFTVAFNKKTGLKPSFFIKELITNKITSS